MNGRTFLASMVLMVGAAGAPLMAQQGPPDGPPDFAEMRQRMQDRMKEFVGASDEEWKAIGPKIEKVQQLQRDAYPRGGGFMAFGGPGGPGGPGGGPGGGFGGGPGGPPPGFGGPGGGQPSEVQQKVQELREALDNKDTSADELKAKAQAVRDARARAKTDLAAAQDDLKQAANARQQAALLAMGVLE
jgi:hypothetical protein